MKTALARSASFRAAQSPMVHRVSFSELAADPDLADVQGGGIYLFLRRFAAVNRGFPTPADLVTHVESICKMSAGHTRRSWTVSHFGEVRTELSFSSPLPPSYLDGLKLLAQDVRKRKAVANLLRGFPAPPVLYVGETTSFSARVKQHLAGSDIWTRLFDAGYTHADVEFLAIPLPVEFSDQERQIVERIVSHLVLAPFTDRAGWGPRYRHMYTSGNTEETVEEEDERHSK